MGKGGNALKEEGEEDRGAMKVDGVNTGNAKV